MPIGLSVQASEIPLFSPDILYQDSSVDNYSGQQISLTTKVEVLMSGDSFTVDNPGLVGGEILVLSPTSQAGSSTKQFTLFQGEQILLQGRVQTFDLDKIKQETHLDLPSDVFIKWQGRPVIVAQNITIRKN